MIMWIRQKIITTKKKTTTNTLKGKIDNLREEKIS